MTSITGNKMPDAPILGASRSLRTGPHMGALTPPGRGSTALGAFTLVEVLVVITIIAFVASTLVVAGRGLLTYAHKTKTQAIIQRLTSACNLFKTDFGYYPPDDWPITGDMQAGVAFTQPENPSNIALWPNANLMLRLLYTYPQGRKQYFDAAQSELRGQAPDMSAPVTGGFEGTRPDPSGTSQPKGLIVVDAWGRPIFYICRTFDPLIDPRTGQNRPTPGYMNGVQRITGAGSYPLSVSSNPGIPARNPKGGDIFSCGADGLTTINNGIDDNQDGIIDYPPDTVELSMLGEAADDINNWVSR